MANITHFNFLQLIFMKSSIKKEFHGFTEFSDKMLVKMVLKPIRDRFANKAPGRYR